MKLCETRWMERLDAVITFGDFFGPIYSALEHIQEFGDNESSKKAFSYQQTLRSSTFIVSVVVIHEVFSVVYPLSAYLQGVEVDLASAMQMTGNVNNQLKEMRDDATETFKTLFSKAEMMAKKIGEEIKNLVWRGPLLPCSKGG